MHAHIYLHNGVCQLQILEKLGDTQYIVNKNNLVSNSLKLSFLFNIDENRESSIILFHAFLVFVFSGEIT